VLVPLLQTALRSEPALPELVVACLWTPEERAWLQQAREVVRTREPNHTRSRLTPEERARLLQGHSGT